MLVHKKRTTCRVCGGTDLTAFLSLGPTPLANAFLASPDEFETERFFPLDVYFCATCSFVQLLDVIDPEVLFGHYLYLSGTSETIATHNCRLAASVCEVLSLRPDDLVVEIASNDGSLLKWFRQRGVRVLGVEPARNIAAVARAEGVDTVERFFSSEVADELLASHGPAAAVIANNVLAHVDDPRGFLAAARAMLRPGGLVIVEVPYVADLLGRLEYDTVYHEHLGYFSVRAMLALAEAVELSAVRIDRVAVHGGSLRVYFRSRQEVAAHAADALALCAAERDAGLWSVGRYQQFAREVEDNRRALVAMLEDLRRAGRTIAGYGAPAKGNTLLNYCGIDVRLVPYIVDKNPLKLGLYTPGTHIPVLPVSTLVERQPDYVLLLAWNFSDEIMRQQSEYRARGGHFIVPIAAPVVV